MIRNVIRGRTAAAIAASVEQAVHAGRLPPGAGLPSIRELASTLGVSPVTVAAAYRRLHTRGLVSGEGRRGTRVRPNPPSPVPAVEQTPISEGLIDLATGNPDAALLPPLDTALRTIRTVPRLYGEDPVLAPLLTFASGEFAADGIAADAMTVTSGGLDAIERLLREHVRPGDRVGLEDPTLPALIDLVTASGYLAEPIALDADGPLPDAFAGALARGARAVVTTLRAQNPTGAALTAERAAQLLRLLRGHEGVLLVENDPAGPVSGIAAASLCAGGHGRWAAVRSVSKFLGPDLRVAIVAGDQLTVARLQGRQSLGARWVSHLLQELTLALWSDPSSGRRLARAADAYTQRRKAALDALAAHGLSAVARSGFNLWIPVREETAAVQSLAARGWAVAAGERFRLGSAPGIRVTTSALAVEAAPRFAADLADSIQRSRAASA
jgi:DNA-binding transcriptional MocR family regulator